jgi:zinc transport system ATP-binding protein
MEQGKTANSVALSVEHVWFLYNGYSVLKDVTFHIESGTSCGLIGPNGGGKTTLLKLTIGLLPLKRGTIRVFGLSPEQVRKTPGIIGYVPQQTLIDWNFPATVEDVVLMGAYGTAGLFRRVGPEIRKRAAELLELTGMKAYGRQAIGKLSVGQQQRVFIARALIAQPQILILDEPTSGIDSGGQHQFYSFIHKLKEQMRLTMLMVSHDVGQLHRFAEQIVCLNQRVHFHDRSELINEEILEETYGCELYLYLKEHKQHLAEYH